MIIAERFGWTLEYIDSLPFEEYIELFYLMQGYDDGQEHVRKR